MEEEEEEEEEICMPNIRMSRTPIEGSPCSDFHQDLMKIATISVRLSPARPPFCVVTACFSAEGSAILAQLQKGAQLAQGGLFIS